MYNDNLSPSNDLETFVENPVANISHQKTIIEYDKFPMKGIYKDSSKKEHDLFPDLVNNEFLFVDHYSNKSKSDITETWPDDCDYSFYPHIDDIINDIISNPKKYIGKNITVRVDSDMIYSSSKKEPFNGYDRPEDVDYEAVTQNLRKSDLNGEERGFISADCPTSNAYVRWHYNKSKKVNGLTIVKYMGNHRFALKKRANGGEKVEILIVLHFHTLNYDNCLEDFMVRESDGHHTDAQDRKGQTENQRAYSGYKAKKKEYIELINLLKEVQIDYCKILQQEKLLIDVDSTPTITSIQGMNGGINSGEFKKYGLKVIKQSLLTCREIALHTNQKESLKVISHSAVMCFANLYYYFTTKMVKDNSDKTPLMTEEQLREFLITKFTDQGKWSKKSIKLEILNQSGGQKDYNVINATKLLRELNDYYIDQVLTKAGTQRKNGFGMDNPAIMAFFGSINDELQRRFAISESGLLYK
jgi:hypothetical protein